MKLVGGDPAEQSNGAEREAYLAGSVCYRRGYRAHSDLVFTVLHRVAALTDIREARKKSGHIRDRMRCKRRHTDVAEALFHLDVRKLCKQELSLRGGVGGKTAADLRDDLYAVAADGLIEGNDIAILQQR